MILLKIKITKKILEQSKYSGIKIDQEYGSECAVVNAVRDIFPEAFVSNTAINPFAGELIGEETEIPLPDKVQNFIQAFDDATPKERVLMDEFEFEIPLQDKVIEQIDIEEVQSILHNHSCLELI